MTTQPKPKRGFAALDPAAQREIAKRGGKAAHQGGNAHEWDSTEASRAGRKGGLATAKRLREKRDGTTR